MAGIWPFLEPWDALEMRATASRWNVPRKYGPYGVSCGSLDLEFDAEEDAAREMYSQGKLVSTGYVPAAARSPTGAGLCVFYR